MSDNNTISNTAVKIALAEDQPNNNVVAQQMVTLMKLVEERERLSLEREKIALEREKVSASLFSEREKIALEKEKLFVSLLRNEMAAVNPSSSEDGSTDEDSSTQSDHVRQVSDKESNGYRTMSAKRVSAPASGSLNSTPSAKRVQVENHGKQESNTKNRASSPPAAEDDEDGDDVLDDSRPSSSRVPNDKAIEQKQFTFSLRKPDGTIAEVNACFEHSIGRLTEMMANLEETCEGRIWFMLRGQRLQPTDTFGSLGLRPDDIITMFLGQCQH